MMGTGSPLLMVKVLGLVAALGFFVWWQFRDLAKARRQREDAKAAAVSNTRSGD